MTLQQNILEVKFFSDIQNMWEICTFADVYSAQPLPEIMKGEVFFKGIPLPYQNLSS